MVRPIVEVSRGTLGSAWYVLSCGHRVIAVDYRPNADPKPHAFCPSCWLSEKSQPHPSK